MRDLMNELSRLHEDALDEASDIAVAADLHRGRAALRARRIRRGGVGTVAVLGLAAVGSLAYVATSGSDGPARHVAGPQSPAVHQPATAQHPSTAQHPTAQRPSAQPAASIELVAYHGAQQPGFRVKFVPEGYVLQGVSGSTLDIAKSGDKTPLNTFSGKLVVGVDNDQPDTGQPVAVGSKTGHYGTDGSGVATLTYKSSRGVVVIQKWSNIHLTKDQLVHFAEGVTVTKDVQVSHG